jgi:hypothetical protein
MTEGHPNAERYALMRRASLLMGASAFHNESWFVDASMRYLASNIGDLHVEFLENDGWSVATCYEEEEWAGWIHGETLGEALANAVVAHNKRPLPQSQDPGVEGRPTGPEPGT